MLNIRAGEAFHWGGVDYATGALVDTTGWDDHAVRELMMRAPVYVDFPRATAAPSTDAHTAGEFVYNSAPAVAGAAGSQYVVLGWSCVATGTPGTWVPARVLTGT